jgi:osmotically-inducible protein OsmY
MRAWIAIASIVASTGAMAQATRDAPRPDFAALDRNRDGSVSRLEASADREVAKRFAYFDGDSDGRLSASEYALAKGDNDKRIMRDAALSTRVKTALLAEKGIPSFSISVDIYEGRVQLSGFVSSPEIVSRAGRVTAKVNGVRAVHNNISVR